MALTVPQLIDEALQELQDDGTRWTREELLAYFNAGQRAIAVARPDQVTQEIELPLVLGARQPLPPNVLALLDISSNVGGQNARITKTKQWQLDALVSNWRSMTPVATVLHYMHDVREPYVFTVYPPAAVGAVVRACVAVQPVDLAAENDAPSAPASWMDALRNYVLFRAWSKDAEFGGNTTIAAAHLQLFNNAMGVQAQSSTNVAPTV